MFRTRYVCMGFLLASALLPVNLMSSKNHCFWIGGSNAVFASTGKATRFPVSKPISQSEIAKYKTVSVTVDENGISVPYEGVPLRTLVSELIPNSDIDSVKGRKELARKKLVAEVTGEDGYPALIAAHEIAIDTDGERFILATRRDGKPLESGPQLVCNLDGVHTGWVTDVVQIRIVAVPKPE